MPLIDVLANLHQPSAVLMLFVATVCLLGYAVPAYRDQAHRGFAWVVFLVVGIAAGFEWFLLVFG